MADAALDSERFYLLDTWPGTPFSGADLPTDGFTGTSHNNVTTAAYPVGTKIAVFNTATTGVSGGSTLIYLQCQELQGTTAPFRAKTWVTPNVISKYYQVTNKATSLCDEGAPAAACVGTNGVATAAWSTTTGRFGWFWCGGVAPEVYCTNMGGGYVTVDGVTGPLVLSNLGTTTTTSGGLALTARSTEQSSLTVAVCSTTDA